LFGPAFSQKERYLCENDRIMKMIIIYAVVTLAALALCDLQPA
jgi:hypothetical protein